MADPPDPNTTDDRIPMRPPPGMQALAEEYRRLYPAFRTRPLLSVDTPGLSLHPLMDALLAEYRQKGLL